MPLHEYRCQECDKVTEEFYHTQSAVADIVDCQCGGKALRIVSSCRCKVWNDGVGQIGEPGSGEARARACGIGI